MSMRDELLACELFTGLGDHHLQHLVELASERHYERDESMLRFDEPADVLMVLRSGRAAVEIDDSGRGTLVIETVDPGDVVGVSWLLPPYRWAFSARAVEDTRALVVNAEELRRRCDADPEFGYELYKRFSAVVHRRLVAARVRALDLYRTSAPR